MKEDVQKIKKIIEIVKNLSRYAKIYAYYDILGIIYSAARDFDKAIESIWKSIHICKGNDPYRLVDLYMDLGLAYCQKNDLKKAQKMFANAKSCCGILPFGHPQIKYSFDTIGRFYLYYEHYDDALWYFETIEIFYYGNELLETKYYIGFIYSMKQNYSKSLEYYLKVKMLLSSRDQVDNKYICIINAVIGKSYYSIDDRDSAHSYFIEAFRLIDYYDYCLYDRDLSSLRHLIDYFFSNFEIKICETALHKAWEILEKNPALNGLQSDLLLIEARLKLIQGKTAEADQCLDQIEKNFKIDKILKDPPEKIQPLQHDEILNWISFAALYVNFRYGDCLKAEKILKYIEEIFKTKFLISWDLKANLYFLLGHLYKYKKRITESKAYYEKSLSTYNQYTSNTAAMILAHRYLIQIENEEIEKNS